jgi:acyl-CoA thioester hydrolase
MGVVYYANYFVWFEIGRTDWLRASGWSYRELEADGLSLPVIEAHCEYRQSARYDDELEIRTTGALVSPVRLEFAYEVVRALDDVSLAAGRTVHAALDRSGRPRRLPLQVRTMFDEATAIVPAGSSTGAFSPGSSSTVESGFTGSSARPRGVKE